MENELTKLQLQEMLREMGVKFSFQATRERLIELLNQENQKKWLGLDEEGNISEDKVVIKRRARKKVEKENDQSSSIPNITIESHTENPLEPGSLRRRPEEKQNFIKPAADVKIVTEYIKSPKNFKTYGKSSRNNKDLVKRRADGFCELCGDKSELDFRYIISPEEGGDENSVKNLVALCESCSDLKEFSKKDLKKLKRKARSRISNEIKVVYRRSSM